MLSDTVLVIDIGVAQRLADPALGDLVLPDDAPGVDLEQDVDAVASPFGDLGGWNSAIEPRRETGVPEVVRAPRQR